MSASTGGYNHWELRRVDGDWLVVRSDRAASAVAG
jgi:hypothetical protein